MGFRIWEDPTIRIMQSKTFAVESLNRNAVLSSSPTLPLRLRWVCQLCVRTNRNAVVAHAIRLHYNGR